jgi:hypothetical protein
MGDLAVFAFVLAAATAVSWLVAHALGAGDLAWYAGAAGAGLTAAGGVRWTRLRKHSSSR